MREREKFFKELCQKKDSEYQALMDNQVQGIEINQKIKAELESEIERKDNAIQKLAALNQESPVNSQQSEELERLKVENRSLKNTNIDLENHINAIQDRLTQIEREGINKHPIKDTINRWKSISKDTRDWTKANKLLEELEKLIK